MTSYLEGVNRILRHEGILAGGDDDVTSFTSSQHPAAVSLAQIAIQSQLADLVAMEFIPFEDQSATITTAIGTRVYTLETDFIRMQENYLVQTDVSGVAETNYRIPITTEAKIRQADDRYKELNVAGSEVAYMLPNKQIGFYPVPTEVKYFRYYYEGDVPVSDEGDEMPFSTVTENETFLRMAARYFKYLFADADIRDSMFPDGIEGDPHINASKAVLCRLLLSLKPDSNYGRH